MSQEHVENLFTCVIYNFPCIYSTNMEGPATLKNMNSDYYVKYFQTVLQTIMDLFIYSLCPVR